MRPRVEWMNQTDDRILELLEESDLVLSPVVMSKNLEYSRSWVSQRLAKLDNVGLVAVDEGSYYYITDKGRDYLAGNLRADDLQLDDE